MARHLLLEEKRKEGLTQAKASLENPRYRKLVLTTALWLIAEPWSDTEDALAQSAMARPIDDVPVDDSLRVSFNSLHGFSVAALGVAIIAAAVALLVFVRKTK